MCTFRRMSSAFEVIHMISFSPHLLLMFVFVSCSLHFRSQFLSCFFCSLSLFISSLEMYFSHGCSLAHFILYVSERILHIQSKAHIPSLLSFSSHFFFYITRALFDIIPYTYISHVRNTEWKLFQIFVYLLALFVESVVWTLLTPQCHSFYLVYSYIYIYI